MIPLLSWTTKNVGSRLFPSSDQALVVHATDGSVWTYHNSALLPNIGLVFKATETLFKEITWTALVIDGGNPTSASSIYTRSNSAFNDTSFATSSILTQPYTLSWGASPWNSFNTFDGVEVDFAAGTSEVTADGYGTIDYIITDQSATARFKPLGIPQSAIDAKLALQGSATSAQGGSLNARGTDLIISGSHVYITLSDAAAKSQGYNFNLTNVRLQEMTAVATRSFTSGAPNPLVSIANEAPEEG